MTWQEQKKKLIAEAKSSIFFYAKIRADGHEITIRKVTIGETKLAYEIFIDGWMKGEWILSDHPFGKKYFLTKKKAVWSPKYLKMIQKVNRKHKQVYVETAVMYPTSLAAYLRHLETTCSTIEIIETT